MMKSTELYQYEESITFWRGFDNPFVDLKLPSPPEGKDGYARSAAWSPNGKLLACSTVFGTIYLWDLTTGKLLHTLKDPTGNDQQAPVSSVAWSPDNTLLASSSYHGAISIWDATTGIHRHTLEGHEEPVCSVVWSPDGELLASGSVDKTIRLWDSTTGIHLHTLEGHEEPVRSLTWSPDNKWIVSGSNDKTVRVWDATEIKLQHTLKGHTGYIRLVAWEPKGLRIASGSHDGTIKIWDPQEGTLLDTLEGHTGQVCSVAWFPNGPLLASVSYVNKEPFLYDAEVRLWHTDTWKLVAFRDKLKGYMHSAWHPSDLQLATVAPQEGHIAIWKLEGWEGLLQFAAQETVRYKNAKVVLVGDSGVGKSGLSLVLTGKPFAATESTHGRYVRTFDCWEVDSDDGRKEMRETLLWDLAGQPDYHLIHQLHLHQATVALIVFDAARKNDALASVRYWERALRLAQQACGSAALPLTIFLVAARIDRGSKRISKEGIEALVQELGCAGYIETSAKTGQGVEELSQAIRAALDWSTLPGVTSTQLLQDIRTHLLREVQTGQLLRTVNELYLSFLRAFTISTQDDMLRQQFEEALGRLDAQGVLRVLRRFSFGNLVLLQPERLDAYASALLIAVGNETDGLGSISEERVREGAFSSVPQEDRVGDAVQERLLLLAMIEELVHQELALREGEWLLFPSQSTRERPQQATWPDEQEVTFSFALYSRSIPR